MINILIVDDSKTETLLLTNLFDSESDMHVVGCAKNGIEAIKMTKQLKPDLITMDILMPDMNGFEATRKIMSDCPTPIVVISSTTNDISANTTFQALNAGALCVLEKLDYTDPTHLQRKKKYLLDTIRSMAEITVIKKRFFTKPKIPTPLVNHTPTIARAIEVIAIGTSVGGPSALNTLFSGLPTDFETPIVVVQHMTPGFIQGFTEWLTKSTKKRIKVASNNELLANNTIYFAPDFHHLTVKRTGQGLMTSLITSPPISGFCPSATVLLESVAQTCGKHAIGILLTGMGSDGANGLLALKNAHGHTLIQDPESAVVFGMAGVAQTLNAVDKVVPLNKIAEYLTAIIKH